MVPRGGLLPDALTVEDKRNALFSKYNRTRFTSYLGAPFDFLSLPFSFLSHPAEVTKAGRGYFPQDLQMEARRMPPDPQQLITANYPPRSDQRRLLAILG